VNTASIDTLLHGSARLGRSSLDLGWKGLIVERRTAPPLARDASAVDCHYALLWQGQPTVTERQYRRGQFVRMVKQPGALSLGPAGWLPAVRAHSPFDVVICAIDPEVADGIADDTGACTRPLHDHRGICDAPLAALIATAAQEVDAGGHAGKVFAESLTLTIISRFLFVARNDVARNDAAPALRADPTPLPRHRLRRVLERIEADFSENLGLAELAAESGYSRAHFLRMFRAATGKTPHQYLQDFRLDYVRRMLASGHAPGDIGGPTPAREPALAELAACAGFSSHSHLSRLFRLRFGVSPDAYRRDCRHK